MSDKHKGATSKIVPDGSRSTRAEAKPSTDKLIDKGLAPAQAFTRSGNCRER